MTDVVPRTLEEQVYCSVVRPGDCCLDIGANAGDVSLLLAKLVGTGGRVVAFEPAWPMYLHLSVRLQSACEPRATVITVPFGLADEEKTATIQVPDGDFGMGSLANAADWSRAQPGTSIASFESRFLTLDGFMRASRTPAPAFIKMDVEGAELLVLRGGRALFESEERPLMLIELFAPWERAFGYGPWDVLSLLCDWGYRFLFACPEGLVEHEPSASDPVPAAYRHGYNVIAYVPERHAARVATLDGLRAGGSGTILPTPPAPIENALE